MQEKQEKPLTEEELLDLELQEARAREAKREAKASLQAKRGELELLKIIDRFEGELGPRGQAFDLLDLSSYGETPIVIKAASPGIQAKLKAYRSSKMDEAADYALVEGNVVHPSAEDFRSIIGKLPIVLELSVAVLSGLLGSRNAVIAKKR